MQPVGPEGLYNLPSGLEEVQENITIDENINTGPEFTPVEGGASLWDHPEIVRRSRAKTRAGRKKEWENRAANPDILQRGLAKLGGGKTSSAVDMRDSIIYNWERDRDDPDSGDFNYRINVGETWADQQGLPNRWNRGGTVRRKKGGTIRLSSGGAVMDGYNYDSKGKV
jgi:hypothetical protein